MSTMEIAFKPMVVTVPKVRFDASTAVSQRSQNRYPPVPPHGNAWSQKNNWNKLFPPILPSPLPPPGSAQSSLSEDKTAISRLCDDLTAIGSRCDTQHTQLTAVTEKLESVELQLKESQKLNAKLKLQITDGHNRITKQL